MEMTPRERMLATFAGQPVDCFPVTAPYLMLLQADHWTEITQQPSWTYYQWCLAEPEEHILEYLRMESLLPFDIAQPNQWASTREERIYQRIEEGTDGYYRVDTRTGRREKLILELHEKDREADWPRTVFTTYDADERIEIISADQILERGYLDYMAAYIRKWGHERFTAGTVVNSFYMTSHYVGQASRFYLLYDEPELMHYIIERLTCRNIEEIRAMARIGVDAIFIDDATATRDMISPQMYDEFSKPYLRWQVEEIHNLGMKAILIYFGGIADRVENIVSVGADALLMETSMKGYTNDLETIAAQVNNRMLLFGNLDPLRDVELGTDEHLETVMRKQIEIGKRYGRFVVSTGSPITPRTPLKRIRQFIDLAHHLSAF